jgi:hypothetical protein
MSFVIPKEKIHSVFSKGMGNFLSTSDSPLLHFPPEAVILQNSSVLACQDIDLEHPAGRPWEQPEGVAVTITLTRLIKEMVPQCLKLLQQFAPLDPSGTMKCFLFKHPDFPDSGDFLVTAIKSNEDTVVYVLSRTLGPIFVRQAILHANNLPTDSPTHLYHKQWNQNAVYQQYAEKCRHTTVICKLVDDKWISAFVYDVLARGFECRAAPLKDTFVKLVKERFQQKAAPPLVEP